MASPTLKDYRDTYYAASVKAGDIARQLAFAGIALIWIFQRTAKDANDSYNLPEELYWPALFIVATLTLDLLQYCFKSAVWGFVQWKIEKLYGPDITKTYTVQEYVNWPSIFFFWGKLLTITISYLLLCIFVVNHINFSQPITSTKVATKVQEQAPSSSDIGKANSNTSLSNNVTVTVSDTQSRPNSQPIVSTEPTSPAGVTALQNNVTITLPVITRTIVRAVPPEKKKDPCEPCERGGHINLKQ